MKYIYGLILFVSVPLCIRAQGQSPLDVKWFELQTKHATIIFPREISFNAQRAANLIDFIYEYETKTLNTKPKKIPVILYNQSTISNGFAGLRPRRSVWFSTPSQYASDLGTDDWYYTLGSHEFRHVVQYSKINRHFTKLMSIVFGETGILMGEYSIPYWFFEGDAVCTETGLSESGRGRIPQFDMPIRSILLSDQKISYDMAKFGSYKTFYPGKYNFGYLMTSQARMMFGPDVFDKTLNHTSKISFWPYAFSRGLKKTTGLNEKKMYKAVMNRMDSIWTQESVTIDTTSFKVINTQDKKSWTRYSEINYLDKDRFIAKKSSMKSDITTFYSIDRNGNEKRIKATDAGMIDVSHNQIVFAREFPDPRWQVRDYSDIIVLDIETGIERRLTKNQKLFAPSFSPDGKSIVATEYDSKMESSLILLDTKNGNVLKRIESPDNAFIRTPVFNKTGDKVVFTLSKEIGTALYMYDLTTESFVELTDFSSENIGRPCFYNHYILYNSPYNGRGNIYALDIESKQRYQVTSSRFGAYNIKVLGENAVYAEYTPLGYDIAEITLNDKDWTKIEDVKKYAFETAEILQQQEQGKNIMRPDLIPDSVYTLKPYNKFKGAFNIHSWQIFTTYPTNTDFISLNDPSSFLKPELGFDIYSANVLNTVYGSLGATYNINEKTLGSNISVILKKFYPEFSISGSWRQRSETYNDDIDIWDELASTFAVSLPLNLSRGIYQKGANIGTSFSFIQNKGKTYRYISEPGDGNFSSLSYNGGIYAFRQQATQDINPKLGYFVYLTYKHIPFNQDIKGNQFSGLASIYLPGAFMHHSLNIKFGYEKQREYDENNNQDYYWYSSPQSFPRGYNYIGFDQLKSMNVNYSLPVLYPDLNIGPFAYFKRIRANIFYDWAIVNRLANSDENINYRSAGIELIFQIYFLRLSEPVELGGRVSYLSDQPANSGNIIPEFLLLGISF